jgi:hypothetical protein
MVLAMGARYASDEQISEVGISRHDVSSLQENMLSHIPSKLKLPCLPAGDLHIDCQGFVCIRVRMMERGRSS